MSEQYIRYEPQLRCMICLVCPNGVSKNGVARHYRKHHKDVRLSVRKDLVKYANNFDLCEADAFESPNTIIPRIEDLAVQQGLRCLHDNCNYACIEPTSMERHCEAAHGWVKSKGTAVRRFFLTLREGVMWIDADVQTVFKSRALKYFPVRTTPLLENAEIDAQLQQALTQASIDDEEETRRNNTIVPETANERVTPWLNRGGWLDMLAGKEMAELYPLTSARSTIDEGFEFLRKSIDSLIRGCLEGVRDLDRRGWGILRFWLNSTQMDKPDAKPFQLNYNDGTVARYSECWLRFILFTLRTFNTDTGENGVKYTDKQRKVLGELKGLISEEAPLEELVHRKVIEISRAFIEHKDFTTNWPSPLKYFCSVMAWDYSTERWRRPGTYTPFLAGIQFCMRVLTCEIALPSEKRDGYCQPRDRGAPDPLDALQKRRKKWLVVGRPYPFMWVHSLLIYGMGVATEERSEDKIRFDGDKYLYWQGHELDIEAWRRFPGDILRTGERILSRELLFQDTDFIDPINPYPISEDQTCRDNRHFFGNRIRGYKNRGRQTIVDNIGIRAQDWMTIVNGKVKWKPAFVSQYARAQNRFLEHILIGINTVGGLTGRGTEMLSLLYHNVPETDRNIILRAGQIVASTEYHKSQNVTDAIKVYIMA